VFRRGGRRQALLAAALGTRCLQSCRGAWQVKYTIPLVKVEVGLSAPFMVDLATPAPGVSPREGGRTVTFTAAGFADTYRLVLLLAQLATIKPLLRAVP
jgi:D-aminopeptidase